MFLMKRGFRVLGRNYLKKWGEIDIILRKAGKLHFVEVKSVSCENIAGVPHETVQESKQPVGGRVTGETVGFRPEENIHPRKLQRLGRTIQSYLLAYGLEEREWQLDAAIVYLDVLHKKAKVNMIEDIIL